METTNGNAGSAAQAQNGQQEDESGFRLKFCTVCASNQNR
jgi:RNA polymerase II subunit A C-terminal domain phosphatase SSU72